jgi:metallo-beta-lactamase family protein
MILDGQETVRIHGKQHNVKASVRQIYGFSGHADQAGLLSWAGNFRQPPRHTYLTHGDEEAALELQSRLQRQPGWRITVPEYLSSYDLI